jgi:2-alkenal reductase
MKQSKLILLLFAVALLALGALACQTVLELPQTWLADKTSVAAPTLLANAPAAVTLVDLTNQDETLVALYQNASPGVVAILNYSETSGGQGSGFVFDTTGHVVTNYHVVEGADILEVDFASGFKTYATLVGTDLDSDLAVLQLENLPAEGLTPLPLGDSEQLVVGQSVVAIGNPFGLSGTMTVGIVSGLGRTMESLRAAPGGGLFTAGDIIQTDAAINPGNSGGPLLNLRGEVVGINRAIRTTNTDVTGNPLNSGIGFAISVNIVKRVVPALIETGVFDYPYLGISSLPELNLPTVEVLGLSQFTGAYVTAVAAGSPADLAGLRAGSTPTSLTGLFAGGDLIIAVDNRPVLQFGDLLSYLLNYTSPGDSIVLTVLRDGQTLELTVELGRRP